MSGRPDYSKRTVDTHLVVPCDKTGAIACERDRANWDVSSRGLDKTVRDEDTIPL